MNFFGERLIAFQAAIPGLGSKKYFCETSAGKFQIKEEWVKAAAAAAKVAAAASVAKEG